MKELGSPSFQEAKFSRRAMLAAGVGGFTGISAIGGIGYGAKEGLFKQEGDYNAVDRYFTERGFPPTGITQKRFLELSPNNNVRSLNREANVAINLIDDRDVLAEVSIDLPETENVYMTISDATVRPGDLRVINTQFNELEYQAVIVGTEFNQSATLNLGEISGPAHIKLLNTVVNEDIAINNIQLYSIPGDSLYETIMRCGPMMGIRIDNYTNFIHAQTDSDKKAALTNDMLLQYPVEIRESDKGELAIIYWGVYSAEDGGQGKDPLKMYKTWHRDYDADIARVLILDKQRRIIETAHQEDNRNGSHQMVVDVGNAPYDQPLHSAYNHGLVGVGLNKDVNGNPIRTVWRPRPIIDVLMDPITREDMYWGDRVIADKEIINETNKKIEILIAQESPEYLYAMSDPYVIRSLRNTVDGMQQILADDLENVA